MTFTMSVPPEEALSLEARAKAAGQGTAEFLEKLLSREMSLPVSVARVADSDDDLDREYEQGYLRVPEDASLTNGILPHLAIEAEHWE